MKYRLLIRSAEGFAIHPCIVLMLTIGSTALFILASALFIIGGG
ncbi:MULTISPECIES: hypothetical protein [unclassified Beijerinckia]|nr:MULTISPECIES: hypothetical protein [unclassified Beijerinckia]MDH7797251.1 hypothetical protein [Beijerinckia sp. GAS462]SEC78076.1 hypothetical protein SAMN05443249_3543 [Beijerinckia sp. 28-YEA-48]